MSSHIPDDDLIRALDAELDPPRAAAVAAHLAHCWTCRTRRAELERGIADFVQLHKAEPRPALPPGDGPSARLRAQTARIAEPQFRRGQWMPGAAIALLLFAAALGFLLMTRTYPAAAGPLPDTRVTPGATRLITREQVCAIAENSDQRTVPAALAGRVFEQYRIHKPAPRTYEVDYLISPSLGGADDIRNLWPQPYVGAEWNARVKDALEDHLRRMVCAGRLDLAVAQQEIAADWVAAYRKHFRTQRPLAAHALFLKDRPWE